MERTRASEIRAPQAGGPHTQESTGSPSPSPPLNSAELARDQSRRLRELCVATHFLCRREASYLDKFLEESNQEARQVHGSARTELAAEWKERQLDERVALIAARLLSQK